MRLSKVLFAAGLAVSVLAMSTLIAVAAFDATGPTIEISSYGDVFTEFAAFAILIGGTAMGVASLFIEIEMPRRSTEDIKATRRATSHPGFLQRFASIIHMSRRRGSLLPDPAIPI